MATVDLKSLRLQNRRAREDNGPSRELPEERQELPAWYGAQGPVSEEHTARAAGELRDILSGECGELLMNPSHNRGKIAARMVAELDKRGDLSEAEKSHVYKRLEAELHGYDRIESLMRDAAITEAILLSPSVILAERDGILVGHRGEIPAPLPAELFGRGQDHRRPDRATKAKITLRRQGETYSARVMLPHVGVIAIGLIALARDKAKAGELWVAAKLATMAVKVASRIVTTAESAVRTADHRPSLDAVGLMALANLRARAGDVQGALWAIHSIERLQALRRALLLALRAVARYEPQAFGLGAALRTAERRRISQLGVPPRPEPSELIASVDVIPEDDGQISVTRGDKTEQIGRMEDGVLAPDMNQPRAWLWPKIKHQSRLEWVLLGGLENRATRRVTKIRQGGNG